MKRGAVEGGGEDLDRDLEVNDGKSGTRRRGCSNLSPMKEMIHRSRITYCCFTWENMSHLYKTVFFNRNEERSFLSGKTQQFVETGRVP